MPYGLPYDEALDKLEREIGRALRESNGVVTQAAQRLGMDRSRLAKLKERLAIDIG